MSQLQPMTRLEVVDIETLEVVKTVDMTTRDPLQIQKMSDSLLRHMNTFQFFVRATPSASPVAVANPDMRLAADFIDKRAEQYLQDHADNDPDTGAVVFHCGEAGREYHSILVELADDLRQASKPTVCATPPAGWNCTRAAGHEGPCAAVPAATPGA